MQKKALSFINNKDDLAEYFAQAGGAAYNIQAESIAKRKMKKHLQEKRCIVPVTGFFEWRHYPNPSSKFTIPHFIHSTDGKALYLGGLYNSWTDKDTGETINSTILITTPANPMMETIHNTKKRMPLVLD